MNNLLKKFKYAALLYVGILLIIMLFSQCNSGIVTVNNVKMEVPPGTIWLKDNLFFDQCEIRNLDFMEFLYWIHIVKPEKEVSLLPDTNCWIKEYPGKTGIFLASNYLRNPKFREYPVIGISYKQVVEYCAWRTDRVNEYYNIREGRLKIGEIVKNPELADKLPKLVLFRLPTKEEWEYAAFGGKDSVNNKLFPYGYTNLIDNKKRFVSVTKEYTNLYPEKMPPGIECVEFGKRNNGGFYNMLGNVSEMIGDSTIVMGLNYNLYLENNSLKSEFKNTAPGTFIGFRCIAENIVNKKGTTIK
ncbi:MAG: SUMF1/EgtB/PvdO family nonheme iron enzyme [Bacteroidota bacterium]|nr:SUMF1/EgtB/PvdO family nonheme iron enzyme [Bacteroidota bacterium]